MSDFKHNQGYIYPITNEEYEKLDEKYFDLEAKGYDLEVFDGQKGLNRYLVYLTYQSYGKKNENFGSSRPCNQQEIYNYAPRFREILGEIDTAKLKYIEYCWYNCSECFDYYEEEEEDNDTNFTIQQAIAQCKEFAKETKIFAGDPHAAKIAEYLQELAAFKDKTPITEKWLAKNDFVLHEVDVPDHEFANLCRDKDYHLYCDDCVEISAELRDEEAGIWSMKITFLDHGDTEELNICTLGQFRMFLAICGLDNIVKKFK